MVSGQGSSGSGSGATGKTSSLSFIPALLANAFFGTGIGLNKGGFTSTGLRDFGPLGKAKGGTSSILDPHGLNQILNSGSTSGNQNPFNFFAGGDAGGGDAGGLDGSASSSTGNPLLDFMRGITGGGGTEITDIKQQLATSPETLGLGQGGVLNPFDLVSNLTDLVNPAINPGLSGGLAGIQSGELGQLLGNRLLFGGGGVGDTLMEGLQTGFKPDLQPVIDEASRSFFQDLVPQLGQSNVALQQGVGPFSTDLTGQLVGAGQTLASQLGSLEVQNQNLAADRRGELLGLSPLLSDTIFNSGINAGRNLMDLGEQFATQGTLGGRQATLLQLLAGQVPSGPIQASSSQNKSKSGGGGIGG